MLSRLVCARPPFNVAHPLNDMTTNTIPIPFDDRTGNVLREFDMALSISENAVNSQLADAWRRWARSVSGFRKLAPAEATPGALEVTLDVPTVSFNLDTGNRADVGLIFPFLKGTIDVPGEGRIDLKGWRLCFTSRLSRREVKPGALRELDEESYEKVDDAIGQMALDEGTFSIECLFLDLSAIANIAPGSFFLDPASAPRPPLSQGAVDAVRRSLDLTMLGKELLLQTVVFPRVKPRDPTFALRSYALKVNRNRDDPRASTLDYLGVFWDGRPMPSAAVCDDALRHLDPWLDPDRVDGRRAMVQGVMTIRGDKITEHIRRDLEEGLRACYQRMAAANQAIPSSRIKDPARDLPWPEAELLHDIVIRADDRRIVLRQNDARNTYRWKDDDTSFELVKTLDMTLEARSGGGYRIDGTITATLYRSRSVLFGFTSDARAETSTSIGGTMRLAAKLQKDANEIPTGFNIVPELDLQFGTPVESSSGNGDWFREGVLQIRNSWDLRQARAFAADSREAVGRMLTASVADINIEMDQVAFIPPGEEVFTFQAPRFNRARDLMLDVMYLGVLPQGLPPAGN